MNGEFYVGYEPSSPPGLRTVLRRTALALFALCLVTAAILTVSATFANSRFEFGVYRDYEGELMEWPYPMLLSGGTRYLLVGPGKFGIADLVKGREGSNLHVRGSLIARGSDQMLEIEPGSIRWRDKTPGARPITTELGQMTLTGEIVDTKCHLGVMNPGEGKVHRDCAVRCISGGVPPGLFVRDSSGEPRLLLLTGAEGRPLHRELLDYMGEPVTVQGRLVKQSGTWFFQMDPRGLRRE
jgi:hypothetical protein